MADGNPQIRAFQGVSPDIHETAYIDPMAVIIGDVTIGEHASIWPFAVARGDVHRITIGSRTNIQDGTVMHVTHAGRFTGEGSPLIVGDGVTVGHGVILHACRIGNGVLVGMGATVLDGAEVGEQAMIGAGALVVSGKKVQPKSLWLGSPARFARWLSDRELEELAYSAENYVKLSRQHQGAPNPD